MKIPRDDSCPLVTVAIPCYNHENFIADSIKSIIKQSYSNIELIIIDDGSKDSSVERIKELELLCESRFTRFKFITRKNKGLTETLNEAIEWSRGKYWTTCSSDDFYHEDKIIKQVEFLERNNNYNFCITKSFVINDLNEILDAQTLSYNSGLDNVLRFEDIYIFKVHLPVTGMYDTKFLKNSLHGFDIKATAEDYEVYLRIATKTLIGVVNEYLYYYRSPEALGGLRKRRPMRLDVSESHLHTIQKYKSHPLYKKALIEWNYRRFIFFSAYKDTKYYALKGMIKSLTKYKEKTFYKSIFKLLFMWKT